MSASLKKHEFTDADWQDVQTFECGDRPYQQEVSRWLKGNFGEDSALTCIRHPTRPGRVWLYKLDDGTLVGFGALAKTEWRWKGKKDPKIPLTILIWYAVHTDFKKRPPGPPEQHYSALILDDLIVEALKDHETHPVLGLCVDVRNQEAIRLYRRVGFAEGLDPIRDQQTGVELQRMAMVLNPEALLRHLDAARKRKK